MARTAVTAETINYPDSDGLPMAENESQFWPVLYAGAALDRRLENAIEPSEDGVRSYFLCRDCHQKATVLGQGKIYRDDDVYIV